MTLACVNLTLRPASTICDRTDAQTDFLKQWRGEGGVAHRYKCLFLQPAIYFPPKFINQLQLSPLGRRHILRTGCIENNARQLCLQTGDFLDIDILGKLELSKRSQVSLSSQVVLWFYCWPWYWVPIVAVFIFCGGRTVIVER